MSLVLITNVSTRLSTVDVAVFEKALSLRGLPRPLTYEEEIRTIRMVQARVFAKAPWIRFHKSRSGSSCTTPNRRG